MIKIGDKYGELYPSWVKGSKGKFLQIFEVIGLYKELGDDFAKCKRTYSDGKTEIFGTSIDLLEEPFYVKLN